MFNRTDVTQGMVVKTLDGERLGKVISLSGNSFEIEKGYFFVKDYRARYADVRDVKNGEVILAITKDGLSTAASSRTAAPAAAAVPATTTTTTAAAVAPARPLERIKEKVEKVKERRAAEGWSDEVRIPLHHEELSWSKSERPAGELLVHKSIVEEEKTITVPLRRERVRVEHRAFTKDQPVGSMAFREETLVVPLHAEGAELRKRQIADEEVVIHKDAIEEQRTYSSTVKREEIDIDEEGTSRARTEPSNLDATQKRY